MDPGTLYMAAAAQGGFFAITQLANRSSLNTPKLLLSIIVILFSVSLFETGLWFTGQITSLPHFMQLSDPFAFLAGPLVYLYFRASFSQLPKVRELLLHCLPFVVAVIYCSQFYFHTASAKLAMYNGEITYSSMFVIYIAGIKIFTLKLISLGFYTYRVVAGFGNKISLKEVRSWFMLSAGVFVLYVVSYAAFHVMEYTGAIEGCADYGIGIASGGFIYLFSWFGWVRPRVFEGYRLKEALAVVPASREKESGTQSNSVLPAIERVMRDEKIYRNEAVRLDTLAGRLDLPRHVVSNAINATGMNFFEYVNYWRIEEAKLLLTTTSRKELNVIEVAFEVGFSNKVSFNRFFKRYTGVTPTDYRRLAVKEDSQKTA